jgi:phosphoenolpyruvate carboxykinase (ATP)
VLPPVSRLSREQAMYHFLSGYTARVAGTEMGVVEPQVAFSACFSAAFLVRHPAVYARLLAERLARHDAQAWLVNTGWTGGKATMPGISRMPIKATRALLNAALDGSLNNAEFRKDPNFGFEFPVAVSGVDSGILDPRAAWSDSAEYDVTAQNLAQQFIDNFAQFADHVDEGVSQSAPKVR